MKILFLVLISLISIPNICGQGSNTQLGQTIYGGFANARLGSRSQLSEDGKILAISGADSQASGFRAGYVRVYELIAGQWNQRGQTLIGSQEFSRFGLMLSLSSDGNVLAIAATSYDHNGIQQAGHVQVYAYDGANWVQRGQDFYGEGANDVLGAGLSLSSSGNRLLIGGISDEVGSGNGRVMVYEYDNNNWVQLGNTVEGEADPSSFGITCRMNADGTVIVVGAPDSNVNGNSDGATYAYSLVGGQWMQIGDRIVGEFVGDKFGTRVRINSQGNIIASSARFNPGSGGNSGHIRVFEEIDGSWVQLGDDIDGEDPSEQLLAMELDATGTILGISSPGNDGEGIDRGVMYVLKYINNEWVQVLADIEGADFERFATGFDINLSTNTIVGGVLFDSTQHQSEGRIEVYGITLEGFPLLSCGPDIIQNVDTNSCEAIVSYNLPTAEDPEDGVLPVTLVAGLPSGSAFPVGSTTITYQATDSSGNSSSCSFIITVTENEPPVPVEPTLEDVTAQCIVSTLIEPMATDNCSTNITVSNNATLPIETQGTTTVIWTYDDGNGNTTTQSQSIIIEDTIDPEVTCPDDLILTASQGDDFAILGDYIVQDSDNCGGIVVSSQDPIAGTQIPVGDTATVTITAIDPVGNDASCSFTVTASPFLNIDDAQLEDAIDVYPNFFDEVINVKIDPNYSVTKLSLYDINGRVLKTISQKLNQSELKLNTSDLSSGMYFIIIRFNDNYMIERLIKK